MVISKRWPVFIIAQEIIHFLSENNLVGTVLLVPVNYKKVDAHTNNAVNDFNTVQDFLNCVVKSKVANFNITLFLVLVFIHSFEIAVVKHCHGAMAISVSAITVEFVGGILQPVITLLFQEVLVNENMVKYNNDLKDFKSIQHFAKVENFLPQNKVPFCEYHY